MNDVLKNLVAKALKALSLPDAAFVVEFPADFAHGDYSTNVALVLGKQLGKNPRELAEQIAGNIRTEIAGSMIEKVEVAGAGFINFHLSRDYFKKTVGDILKQKKKYGTNARMAGKKVIIEYTDPNPFKAFHIGHLMSNAIGESLSRLIESEGAEVVRACYQGDVGLHVAKAIYGMQVLKEEMPAAKSSASAKSDIAAIVSFLGKAYATGSKLYETSDVEKAKVQEINKKVYELGDASRAAVADKDIKKLYDFGRKYSLKHFEEIYRILGTKFDQYFFESEVAGEGKRIVEENIRTGVFEVSNAATVFRGEKQGLHTRVFITKDGLPTYEAKEIGLTMKKFDTIHPDFSIVVTAEEQSQYFKVVLKAIEQMYPDIAAKTRHVAHGMLVLPTGKMSSRTGDVITGESLIKETVAHVREKMAEVKKTAQAVAVVATGVVDLDNFENTAPVTPVDDPEEFIKITQQVAVAAIKYMMLRQSPGKNIIYDMEKSLSLEGDSGPYLQYATVRARSVLEKAKAGGIKVSTIGKDVKISEEMKVSPEIALLEKLLSRFPEIAAKAARELMPSDIVTYLVQLAAAFNAFYAREKIAGDTFNVALTTAFAQTMENGLDLLGIEVPSRM